jgi:AcrR family transcriptional regulator
MNERSFIGLAMRDGSQTKERLDRAAIRLLARQGLGRTSIRQIAAEAGISLGALYNHYASKEDLIDSLFSQNWATVGRDLQRISHEAETLKAQIFEMVSYIFHFCEQDWELATLTFSQRHSTLPKMPKARNNPYLAFRMSIVAAMKRGEIPKQDPDVATAMVMGAIAQVIDTALLGRIKKKLRPSLNQVANSCLALLGSDPDCGPRYKT